jgi:hypothetical protein
MTSRLLVSLSKALQVMLLPVHLGPTRASEQQLRSCRKPFDNNQVPSGMIWRAQTCPGRADEGFTPSATTSLPPAQAYTARARNLV